MFAVTAAFSGAAFAGCATVPVTFRLADAGAIDGEKLYINGDLAALGNWSTGERNAMVRSSPGGTGWEATLQLPPATPIQYKFVRQGSAGPVWEGEIATFSGNRQALTPACGGTLVLDAGHFVVPAPDNDTIADQPSSALPAALQQHLQAFAAAFNSKDPQRMQRFIEQHGTPELANAAPWATQQLALAKAQKATAGLDLRAVRTYTPTRDGITALFQDRIYGGWYAAKVTVEEGGAQRIKSLMLSPARPAQLPAQPVANEKAMLGMVEAAVKRGCSAGAFSGSILVAHNGRVKFEQSCGESSKRYHVRNNMETKYNLASMNKMFTAVAIAQLADQGKLSLDDKISRFVDESWLPRDVTDRITVRHLLTHTSGLGNFFNEKFMASSRDQYREVADYKPLVRGDKPAFEPGQQFMYSNIGMLLAGVIVEQASGDNYFDYVRQHVFQPAGMRNTDSYALDEPVENLAMGYTPAERSPYGWKENTFIHVLRGGPAGGGYSTVRDLNRFATALSNGALLPKSSVERLWKRQEQIDYALGFESSVGKVGRVVGHSGGFAGINGELNMYVDRGYVVAVLANQEEGASPLAEHIGGLIARMPQ
ncbi:hypothetical protein GCM10027277_21870 [Pseudoduganella ginsengisoli]|uniref:serine hydrolase n=1 Tax=Pseudoduganella ginsengisoli TaxID=1462440 RepID=UPI00147895E8